MCCVQNAGQNCNIKTDKFFQSVAKFKYLGTGLTNQNCIHEEITVILTARHACYHLLQNLLSSCLFSKNILTYLLHGAESFLRS
jgi:hypothetical protein